jgi:hypothetical protein
MLLSFKILDFGFTLVKLCMQLVLINYIRATYGLPIYLIGDAIENIVGIYRAFRVFMKSCYLVYMIKKYDFPFIFIIQGWMMFKWMR